MSFLSELVTSPIDILKAGKNLALDIRDIGTNDVGRVLHDLGNITGDPVLSYLGMQLHDLQNRSQTIKDIEANAPLAAALYFGGEYVAQILGGGGGGGAAGGVAGASTSGAGAVGTGAGGAASAGGAAAAGGGAAAAAGSGGAAAAGAAATTGQTQGAIAEITAVIAKVEAAIHTFISPITDTVNEINNGIIKPILGPIETIQQENTALRDFIHGDLHDGIVGILKIPGDLADALNSVDASFARALLQATAAQTQILTDSLNAAGPNIGSAGSAVVAAGIASGLPGEPGTWTPPQRDKLTDSVQWQQVLASAESMLANLEGSEHWYDRLWAVCFSVFAQMPIITAQYAPYSEAAAEAQHRLVQSALLNAGDVLEAYKRGLLSEADSANELHGVGLNDSRVQVLKDLQRTLPGLGDALSWQTRGLLTDAETKELLGVLGYADEDVIRYQDANETLPNSGDAVRWYQRGDITEQALNDYLKAQGYNPDTILAIKAGSTLLPQLADWMRLYDRELALSENPDADSNADNPPTAYMQAAERLGISVANASVLWANHLQLLPPGMAVHSYFRGFINRDQLYAFMRAAGVTRDMADMYVDASRPTIPFRSIPSLVKLGILAEADAVTELKALGFSDIDVDRIMQLSQATTKATGSATATSVHRDVQQTTVALYNAGTLTRDQAQTALLAAGLTQDGVTALLNLEDVKNTAAAHKLEVETVLLQVEGGGLNAEQATAALATYGLSTREQALAVAKINTATRRRVKVPPEATLLNMARRGIITGAEAISNLVLLGYSQDWAQKLLLLEEAEHGPVSNT